MPEINDADNGGQDKAAEFKAPTTQEEFDRMVGDRLNRERAKFADYDDIKSKAAKLDEIEQASKTELEKERERAEAAEKRAAQAERTSLQVRIATELGVPQEAVHGDDEEAMRTSAQRLVEWRDTNKKPAPKPQSLSSGSSGESKTGEKGRAAAALRTLRQG